MLNDDIFILAQKGSFRSGIDIAIVTERGDVAEKVVLHHQEVGLAAEPALTISETAAQKLMDELWNCGIRPSEGSGSAGMLAATQAHLKDMRKIASKFLKTEL